MEQRSSPLTIRLFLVGAIALIVTLLIVTLLPHNRYVVWQATRNEAFARLGWMYERIHYEPAPLDVVFIGTSHTLNGVDGITVARSLAAGAR